MKFKNKNIEIDGRLLVNRPEDRIKKVRKIWKIKNQ
jgi:RNase P/RNase MRP subunit p29